VKRIATHAGAVLVGIIAVLLLSGCADTRIKQVSGSEFMKQAGQIEQMNSFHWTTYVGNSSQRAYLEFGYPAYIGEGVRTTVFWTPLSELPEDVAQKLKAGTPPWKPWQSETNKKENN
jgi:hypothetical protein